MKVGFGLCLAWPKLRSATKSDLLNRGGGSMVTPVTAMLAGRGRRGAAMGRLRTVGPTDDVMLLMDCWLMALCGRDGVVSPDR